MNVVAEEVGNAPVSLRAELHQALKDLSKGLRPSREEAKRAAAEMDAMREENRKRFGEINIAVDLIREGRDRQ